jgi:hypothetical protein
MSKKRFWIVTGILVVLAVAIRLYSSSKGRVEDSYSNGFYPGISSFFRIIFGWIPFSIGDILYGLVFIWLVRKLVKGIIAIFQRKITRQSFLNGLKKTVLIVLSIYIIFNLFWGINYDRKGIVSQLQLNQDTFSFKELKDVTMLVAEKLNSTKKYLLRNKVAYPSNSELFKKVETAYDKTAVTYPFLAYHHASIKPSMWGWVGNYTGFTGYYNPFTGEAQVNTYVPDFLKPFVACHEVGHQIGYAKEDEASAVGYLAALHSGDSLLLYSTYFDLYNSARRELLYQSFMQNDTTSVREISTMLIPEVKADIKEMLAFFTRHKNAVEPFIRKGYAFYLKNNNQPKGMQSYDEVTAFLIAYYRKFKVI